MGKYGFRDVFPERKDGIFGIERSVTQMKQGRKRLCGILLLCVLFSLFPAVSGSASQTEVPEGYIGITSVSDLTAVTASPDGKYILMNDLSLAETGFLPLCSEDEPFSGIFDGNGYAIIGLSVTLTEGAGGLFSFIDGGTVRDLTVNGVVQAPFAGLICGKAAEIDCSGCEVRGTVCGKYAGGLCGQIEGNDSRIADCFSAVALSPLSADPAEDEICLGGFCGAVYGDRNTLNGLSFSGTLSGTCADGYAGGIVGQIRGAAVSGCNCLSAEYTLISSGDLSAGGICGECDGTAVDSCVFSCVWQGTAADLCFGGICGRAENSILLRCLCTGSLNGTGTSSCVGGICGALCADEENTVSEIGLSSFSGTVTGTGLPVYLGGIVGSCVGENGGSASVCDCSSHGYLFNGQEPDRDISGICTGGIAGAVGGTDAKLIRCFSLSEVYVVWGMCDGAVTGLRWNSDPENGHVSVEQCYYPVGVTDHFATALTAEQLTDPEAYVGFDFETAWYTDANGIPRLPVENLPEEPTPLPGDTDGDGVLSRMDVIWSARYLTDGMILSDGQKTRGDTDGDGVLTAADLMWDLRTLWERDSQYTGGTR